MGSSLDIVVPFRMPIYWMQRMGPTDGSKLHLVQPERLYLQYRQTSGDIGLNLPSPLAILQVPVDRPAQTLFQRNLGCPSYQALGLCDVSTGS